MYSFKGDFVTQFYVGIQLSFVAFLSAEVNYLERDASFLAVSFGYGRDNSQSILSIRQLPGCFEFGKPSGDFFNQLVVHRTFHQTR